MAYNTSIWLLPLMLAFLIYVGHFYIRERAASMMTVGFIMASLCMIALLSYLALSVLGMLVPYMAFGYGMAGIVLLVLAFFLFRM